MKRKLIAIFLGVSMVLCVCTPVIADGVRPPIFFMDGDDAPSHLGGADDSFEQQLL
ncbi:MAG: hypothetical protein LBE76_08695 [Nitrososphaerota archaeon]|jgi:hypothetical protein|nr:hypothetical protein [Nitrososphaerota archaeon]